MISVSDLAMHLPQLRLSRLPCVPKFPRRKKTVRVILSYRATREIPANQKVSAMTTLFNAVAKVLNQALLINGLGRDGPAGKRIEYDS
jgi:hypothetical protein